MYNSERFQTAQIPKPLRVLVDTKAARTTFTTIDGVCVCVCKGSSVGRRGVKKHGRSGRKTNTSGQYERGQSASSNFVGTCNFAINY